MRLDILHTPDGNHSAHFIPLGCETFISAVSVGKVSYRKCHWIKTKRQGSLPHLGPQRDEVERIWFCLKRELIAGRTVPNIVRYLNQ